MAPSVGQAYQPGNGPRFFLYQQSAELSGSLGRLVELAQGDDPLAPVTVVGLSTYANLTLRHGLARNGFANVRFLVFPRLAEFQGSPSLAAQGRRPLTSVLESASVRAAMGGTSGILSELRSHTSTIQSVKSAFRQLRHASEAALTSLASRDQLRREVVGLYRSFREHTREFYDAEDLAQAAATAVRRGQATGLADLGSILFFQVRGLSPGQRGLVAALAELGRCALFLGLTGDDEADAPVEALAQELSPFLGSQERSATTGAAGPGVPSPAANRLLIAPDPHEEVRWVIRQLAAHAETGMPFRRMAVLYGAQAPYNTLVREELLLAGFPVAGPKPSPLSKTAVGRTLTGLLQLSLGELPRDGVTAWLTGCPVRPPTEQRAENFSPSNWDAISKKAAIVGGLPQWTERLDRYASETERSSRAREEKGEISEAQASLMLSEARSARELQRFLETLAEDLSPPPPGSSWSTYSRWALGLLRRYLAPEGQIPPPEQESLAKIKDILDGLAAADSVEASPTQTVFVETLEEALQAPVGHLGVTGKGVFVGPIAAAAGMSFDLVHIAGMIEGAVPPPTRDDPLVPDRDRQAAGGPAAGLPLQSARLAEERYAFLSALASAPDVSLSFPRSNPAGQRAHYPSRWFLEQASTMEDRPVHSSTLGELGDRPWLTVIPSMEQSLATASSRAADLHDYDLEHFWAWQRAGLDPKSHPLARSGVLARSLNLGRSRYGSRDFTEWDGNLSGAAAGPGLAKRLETSALSPTSLERWAGCPFRYFLGNVLRVSALEDPEEIYSMTSLEKGSLVHKVLEEFILKVREEGTLPQPGQSWNAEHRRILEGVAQANFRQAELRGVTGKELMWQLVQEDIVNELHSFLEADTALRERFGLSPSYFEARFGMGENSWSEAVWLRDGGFSIRFRGVIDRVDADPAGRNVLVLDYKSGGSDSYAGLKADPIDRGKHLQLAVYSLAAQNALGADARVQAAYWFVSSGQNFSLVPQEPLEFGQEDVRERFGKGVSTIVSGIGGGLFPANPGAAGRWGDFENCRYCDFKSLCPSRKDTLWDRKKGSPLLARYLQLSEGA